MTEETLYIKCCSVCKKVMYHGTIITEEELRKRINVPYRLTHTFLSSCMNEYIDDVKNNNAYKTLAEKCEE